MTTQLILSQILVGLINGAFYAMLSLGMAIIFGMLRIVNFAHGALFTTGAFAAWGLNEAFSLGYWPALFLAPLVVGLFGVVLETVFIRRIYHLDHIYGLLLTLGLALIIEGLLRIQFGANGLPYSVPESLSGGVDIGFMYLPIYRGWVVFAALFVCLAAWLIIERTPLGARLRAATENPVLVRTFGIRVPLMITMTYGAGAALAALAGVLAAPIYSVNPNTGEGFMITVFALVVIGGMGSIMGAISAGFLLGLVEGVTRVVYPEASAVIIFVVMLFTILLRSDTFAGRGH